MKKFLLVLMIITFCSTLTFAAKHNYIFLAISGRPADCKVMNIEDAKVTPLFTQFNLNPKEFSMNDFMTKINENGYKIVQVWYSGAYDAFIIEKE